MSIFWSLALVLSAVCLSSQAAYIPKRHYQGNDFFSPGAWTFYDNVDNTTWGNNSYLSYQQATSQGLAYVDQNTGRAILRVDNVTNVPPPTEQIPHIHRNSVRITSTESYDIGSLILIDIQHLPYGCSVWPAFWTLGGLSQGAIWPAGGEIDVIETINLMQTNQMAVHTDVGCVQRLPEGQVVQSGTTLEGDCNNDRGCVVREEKPNAVGEGFAMAGGGVWALQMDFTGIYMWFWSRPDVPANIRAATPESSLELTDWGLPSASYPVTGCDLTKYFLPQHLILNIALCGLWAGVPDIYASTCQTPTMNCVNDNIIGVGSPKYDQAYFEINYIRTYIVQNGTVNNPGSPVSTFTIPGGATVTATGAAASATDPFPSNSASRLAYFSLLGATAVLLALSWLL